MQYHGLCSPEDGHNDARNMSRQKLIINIWLLHLVGFLSLHMYFAHDARSQEPKETKPFIMFHEKYNKMQQSDVYYQLLSRHVSGIIMPIFRRTKAVCYCVCCTALVLLDVVGSGCGALCCRMRAVLASYNAGCLQENVRSYSKYIYSKTLILLKTKT